MKTLKEFIAEGEIAEGEIAEGADQAKIIRTALKKEYGLTNRDVSVRSRMGATSSAVTVKLKSTKALTLRKHIEEIGNSQNSFQHDARTGEILAGGNTFVFTDIDFKFERELEDRIQKEFDKQTGGRMLDDGDSVLLFDTFMVTKQKNGMFVSMSGSYSSSDVRDTRRIGNSVLNFIQKIEDYSLYSRLR